ncbi:MAG: hypothetical protein ACXVEF_30335 [Polyangiales bacterium]
MRIGFATFVIALLLPSIAHASELDPQTGAIVFTKDAVKTWSFESGDELVASKAQTTKYDAMGFPPKLVLSPVDAAGVEKLLTSGDAVEGKRALRVGGGGVALMDDALFASLATAHFEITYWSRPDGTGALVQIQYGKSDWPLASGFDFANTPTMRTGRETTDGWVEYTTGSIDGSVWGVPIRAIVLTTSSGAPKGTTAVIDALEIRKVPGNPVSAVSCSIADVDSTCGPTGDCLFGRCVPSSVTWGVLPSADFRKEFADRWSFIASSIVGDRNASAFGRETLTPSARDLARYALSSRQFFGGMNRLVNGLHDNHTSFGSPPGGFQTFSPMLFFGWSGALHACFGVMEKDELGGGLGIGVFKAGDKPITGVPLKPGDIVTSIDKQDPIAWADAIFPGIDRTSTNDPRSWLGTHAQDLAIAITTYAKTFTVTRCASSTKCTGDDKQEITIEVSPKVVDHLLANGGWGDSIEYFGCSPRFVDSVADFDMDPGDGDLITPRTVDGIVNVQFDGFSGTDTWKPKMSSVFDPKPAKVLMDARQGNGGTGDNVEHLLGLMRGGAEPVGFITVVNGAWNDPSPADLFDRYGTCVDGSGGGSLDCQLGAWGFFSSGTASGDGSKIAWLNTVDVSANDYMPRLLKGRSKLQIFAPVPTSGAFGAITSFASFMPGWGGGSLQFQDSRFAADYTSLLTSRWESSHGVEPDVVIAQKQSDAIDGKDTMLNAARAWLKAD